MARSRARTRRTSPPRTPTPRTVYRPYVIPPQVYSLLRPTGRSFRNLAIRTRQARRITPSVNLVAQPTVSRRTAPISSVIRAAANRPDRRLRSQVRNLVRVSNNPPRSPKQRKLCKCSPDRSDAQRRQSRKFFRSHGSPSQPKQIGLCAC